MAGFRPRKREISIRPSGSDIYRGCRTMPYWTVARPPALQWVRMLISSRVPLLKSDTLCSPIALQTRVSSSSITRIRSGINSFVLEIPIANAIDGTRQRLASRRPAGFQIVTNLH